MKSNYTEQGRERPIGAKIFEIIRSNIWRERKRRNTKKEVTNIKGDSFITGLNQKNSGTFKIAALCKLVPLELHPHRIEPTGWNIFSSPCGGL